MLDCADIGFKDFARHGCPNCEALLSLQGNEEQINECTSITFEGVATILDPEKSWVAKWQRVDSFVPGRYAVKVQGKLPKYLIDHLANQGVQYRARDGSEQD
jgi:transcription elongation factor SPT4